MKRNYFLLTAMAAALFGIFSANFLFVGAGIVIALTGLFIQESK